MNRPNRPQSLGDHPPTFATSPEIAPPRRPPDTKPVGADRCVRPARPPGETPDWHPPSSRAKQRIYSTHDPTPARSAAHPAARSVIERDSKGHPSSPRTPSQAPLPPWGRRRGLGPTRQEKRARTLVRAPQRPTTNYELRTTNSRRTPSQAPLPPWGRGRGLGFAKQKERARACVRAL